MSNPIPQAYQSCHMFRFDPHTGEESMWDEMLELIDFSRVTMLIFLDLDQCPDLVHMQHSFDPGVVIIGCHGYDFPTKRMLSDTAKGTVPKPMQELIDTRRLLLIAAGKGDQAVDVAIYALAREFTLIHEGKRVAVAFVSDDDGYVDQMLTMGPVPTVIFSPQESMYAILAQLKDYWNEQYGAHKKAGTPADLVAEPDQPGSVQAGTKDKTLVTPVSAASEDVAEEAKGQPHGGKKRAREGEGNEDGEEAVGGERLKYI